MSTPTRYHEGDFDRPTYEDIQSGEIRFADCEHLVERCDCHLASLNQG